MVTPAVTRLTPPTIQRASDVVLVVNTHASGARPELVDIVATELARWGGRPRTLLTETSHEWIEALNPDTDRRVVLVGGDGTLHAAANMRGPTPELALIPAGRGNNIARSLGIPLDPRAAARLAVEGHARPIDAIEAVTDSVRYVAVEGVSAGFFSLARSRYHETNSGHLARALAAGAGAFATFHPPRARIVRDGSLAELDIAQLFVANLPLYGVGLLVAPEADPTDRLLDVVAIEGHGRHALLPMIARLRRGTELENAEAHHWLVNRVRIDTHGAVPVIADTVDLGPGPVELSVLPRELPLVRP